MLFWILLFFISSGSIINADKLKKKNVPSIGTNLVMSGMILQKCTVSDKQSTDGISIKNANYNFLILENQWDILWYNKGVFFGFESGLGCEFHVFKTTNWDLNSAVLIPLRAVFAFNRNAKIKINFKLGFLFSWMLDHKLDKRFMSYIDMSIAFKFLIAKRSYFVFGLGYKSLMNVRFNESNESNAMQLNDLGGFYLSTGFSWDIC